MPIVLYSMCLSPCIGLPSKIGHGESVKSHMRVLLALYDYKANTDAPGGFPELSMKKGNIL